MRLRTICLICAIVLAGCDSRPQSAPQPGQSSTAPPEAHESQQKTVYRTKSGSKYHRASCSYLRKSAIPLTKADAIARGLAPCSRCSP